LWFTLHNLSFQFFLGPIGGAFKFGKMAWEKSHPNAPRIGGAGGLIGALGKVWGSPKIQFKPWPNFSKKPIQAQTHTRESQAQEFNFWRVGKRALEPY